MTLPILMIKIILKKQNTTRLLYINSCQIQMKPFVWAGHACTMYSYSAVGRATDSQTRGLSY